MCCYNHNPILNRHSRGLNTEWTYNQWRLNARAYLGFSPGPRPIRGLLKNIYIKKKMINVRIRGVITLLYSGICWWRWREPPPPPPSPLSKQNKCNSANKNKFEFGWGGGGGGGGGSTNVHSPGASSAIKAPLHTTSLFFTDCLCLCVYPLKKTTASYLSRVMSCRFYN